MLVCMCVRQWNTDTCTHYCRSACTCSEGRGWSLRSALLMMAREAKLQLHATLCWAPHPAPVLAPNLHSRLQSLFPTPGYGTKTSFSWLVMVMQKKWRNTARECGAMIRNAKNPKGNTFLLLVRKEAKGRERITPTELPGTHWTPEKGLIVILVCKHNPVVGLFVNSM